ncbi:MAG TPA: SIS domain-containing protein [Vicinamibacterales bacterium]|nr:SIS domain-containing protein [Vicinamibacterales bacterium]
MALPGSDAAQSAAMLQFNDEVLAILGQIRDTQAEALERAAVLVADTVGRGGIVHSFGSGHSQSVALEFYYRAGGLAPCDVIYDQTFGRAERLPGYAAVLMESRSIGAGDLLVVVSNSGRNPLPVEMALEGRRRGAAVVGITSLAHSRSVAPREPLGKRLFEVCDVVIDNCGVPGDALVPVGNGPLRVGAVSTLAGVFIVQLVVCRAAEVLAGRGLAVPVLCSMNLDEGDDHNRLLLSGVRDRVRGM